jgi:hypothetical protein
MARKLSKKTPIFRVFGAHLIPFRQFVFGLTPTVFVESLPDFGRTLFHQVPTGLPKIIQIG